MKNLQKTQDTNTKFLYNTISTDKGLIPFEEVKKAVGEMAQDLAEKSLEPMKKEMVEMKNAFSAFANEKTVKTNEDKINFVKAVNKMLQNQKINVKGQSLIVDGDGGALVIPDIQKEIVEKAMTMSSVVQYVSKRVTGSNSTSYRKALTTAVANWIEEGSAITESKSTFGKIDIVLKKLGVFVEMTDEFYSETPEGYSQIVKDMSDAVAHKMEDLVINGATIGSTTFKGLLTDSNIPVKQLGTGKVTFASITADDLIDMIYTIQKSPKKGFFVISRTLLATIHKLKDSTGQYILSNAVVTNGIGSILGTDVVISDFMPKTTDATQNNKPFIVFGDLSAYEIAMKGDSKFSESDEFKFDEDKKVLKLTSRLAGYVKDPQYFVLLKTANA